MVSIQIQQSNARPFGFAARTLLALIALGTLVTENLCAETGIVVTTKSRVVSGIPGGEDKESAVSRQFRIAPVTDGNVPDWEAAMTVSSDASGTHQASLAVGKYWIGDVAGNAQSGAEETIPAIVDVVDGVMTPVTLVRVFYAPSTGPGGGGITVPQPDDVSYESWLREHFSQEEIDGSGSNSVTARTADPDKDELTNFAEFSFGTNPKSPGPVSLRAHLSDNGTIEVKFRRKPTISDSVQYGFQVSVDLQNWQDVSQQQVQLENVVPTVQSYVVATYTIRVDESPASYLRVSSTEK